MRELRRSMKTYHRFAYSAPIKEGEEPKPFKTRDGAAFNELTAGLQELGHRYGSLIYNYPFTPFFTVDHLKDLPSLAAKLKTPADEVSRFFHDNVSDATREILSTFTDSSSGGKTLRDALVDELNKIVRGNSIYAQQRFASVRLSKATQNLISQNPKEEEVRRLNRLLFEDAFPRELTKSVEDQKLGPEHFAFLKPQEILVLTTRAPLHDEQHGDKKIVKRSHSDLEQAIFDSLSRYFKVCARSHVQLTEDMARNLKGAAAAKAVMRFHQHKDARVVEYMALDQFRPARVPEEDYITAAFFVHLGKIERYGCKVIASFGMGGIETLIWNRIVRNHPRYTSWLTKPVFVMAELNLKTIPSRPIALDFVGQLKADVLLEEPL